MAKFKIGDKVKVIKSSCDTYWYSDHISEEFNIIGVNEYEVGYETDYCVCMHGISDTYLLSESDIELVECNGVNAKGNPYNFTKDMLKMGMGVVYREGGSRLHIQGALYDYSFSDTCFTQTSLVEDYTACFYDKDGHDYLDIVQIFDWDTKETIWQRVEKPVESEAQKKAEELKREINN